MNANGNFSKEWFDVIIAGGGPAGTATAFALVGGDPSLRVAVVAGARWRLRLRRDAHARRSAPARANRCQLAVPR